MRLMQYQYLQKPVEIDDFLKRTFEKKITKLMAFNFSVLIPSKYTEGTAMLFFGLTSNVFIIGELF